MSDYSHFGAIKKRDKNAPVRKREPMLRDSRCRKCRSDMTPENHKKYNGICWTCHMTKKCKK